jgi:hypothetical protein
VVEGIEGKNEDADEQDAEIVDEYAELVGKNAEVVLDCKRCGVLRGFAGYGVDWVPETC